jgi:hypothetical protein
MLAFVATEGRWDSYAVECGDPRFVDGAPCLSTGFTQALVGVRTNQHTVRRVREEKRERRACPPGSHRR